MWQSGCHCPFRVCASWQDACHCPNSVHNKNINVTQILQANENKQMKLIVALELFKTWYNTQWNVALPATVL